MFWSLAPLLNFLNSKKHYVPFVISLAYACGVFIHKFICEYRHSTVADRLVSLGAKLAKSDDDWQKIALFYYSGADKFLGVNKRKVSHWTADVWKERIKKKCKTHFRQKEIDDRDLQQVKEWCTVEFRPISARIKEFKNDFRIPYKHLGSKEVINIVARGFQNQGVWIKDYENDKFFWDNLFVFISKWCSEAIKYREERIERYYWKFCR